MTHFASGEGASKEKSKVFEGEVLDAPKRLHLEQKKTFAMKHSYLRHRQAHDSRPGVLGRRNIFEYISDFASTVGAGKNPRRFLK